MSSRKEYAVSKFSDGFNCAQAVFSSFCDELAVDRDTALRISGGFGAGMGRKGEVCGAVSGGIMVIGAKFGRDTSKDVSAAEVCYKKTNELMKQFADKFGTTRCRELLDGCDLSTPEGQQSFSERELKKNICIPCVAHAAALTEELLAE